MFTQKELAPLDNQENYNKEHYNKRENQERLIELAINSFYTDNVDNYKFTISKINNESLVELLCKASLLASRKINKATMDEIIFRNSNDPKDADGEKIDNILIEYMKTDSIMENVILQDRVELLDIYQQYIDDELHNCLFSISSNKIFDKLFSINKLKKSIQDDPIEYITMAVDIGVSEFANKFLIYNTKAYTTKDPDIKFSIDNFSKKIKDINQLISSSDKELVCDEVTKYINNNLVRNFSKIGFQLAEVKYFILLPLAEVGLINPHNLSNIDINTPKNKPQLQILYEKFVISQDTSNLEQKNNKQTKI